MKITNLWEKLSQPSQSLESFKKDVAEGKVPELPYYIVGQNDLKTKILDRIENIDSDRMTTNLIIASYGNGKTNLLKYLQLFFNKSYKEYGIKVHYSRADVDRTDIVLFLIKIIQDNYLERLVEIITEIRTTKNIIPSLTNNFQNNFAEIKEYTDVLFKEENDNEKIIELIYLGTGRLSNKRYFDKYELEQLKDFNRREILVLLLNLLAIKQEYIIFAIDEIEKIREKSKIRFNHFLTSYRELVDLFNQIKGHSLIIAMTDSIDSSAISEANNALYTRIKDDIIPIEVLNNKKDVEDLIGYLNDLFGTDKEIDKIYNQSRKKGWENNRILIQEISKLLHNEIIEKKLSELLDEFKLDELYLQTKNKLDRDEAFKNLHRKFFDPLEYYIESNGIDSKLNKQERVFIDETLNKVHYFIFNTYIEDFQNEKIKISNLLNDNLDKQVVIYSPENLGLTNSLVMDKTFTGDIQIIDYIPEELFVILEMYRSNFDLQPKLNDIISYYTKQNL